MNESESEDESKSKNERKSESEGKSEIFKIISNKLHPPQRSSSSIIRIS
jgi:hypothetical protein